MTARRLAALVALALSAAMAPAASGADMDKVTLAKYVLPHEAFPLEQAIRRLGAKLVVFGHTHREALADGYANTGSFAFHGSAPGRPFLEIEGTEEHPRAVRRYWPASP